jgi:hypothetical protein
MEDVQNNRTHSAIGIVIATASFFASISALINTLSGKARAVLKATTRKLASKVPPIGTQLLSIPTNACEYPIAFQLFPVSQYLNNSEETQMKGAATMPMFPNRRNEKDKIAAKSPGKIPTVAVTHSKRKYASAHGKPAYVIGANVSHQHVPVKKTRPNNHPRTNDRTNDSFSRSIAQSRGTRATHARNQKSKSGNARISRIAESMASAAFFQSGSRRVSRGNFMRTV